jgi:uracil-DNA glycosylase family 4
VDDARRSARAWLARDLALGTDWIPRRPLGSFAVCAADTEGAVSHDAEVDTPIAPDPLTQARSEPGPEPDLPLSGESGESEQSGSNVAPTPGRPNVAMPDVLTEPGIRQATTLDQLQEVLGDCRRCKLCDGRTNIVYGVGNPNAELMFVGEGPGEDEDLQGEPFVGRAGKLLTDIIEKGMGMPRASVYIANVVKCRPPGNRAPQPDEIAACEQFLARQVELVAPQVIITLGKFASHVLLRSRTPITRMRGTWHNYGQIPVMPTFHPAYLLRTPSGKRDVWADVKSVLAKLGKPVPGERNGG